MASASLPRLRLLPSTSNTETLPFQPLQYSSDDERTSYFIFKDPGDILRIAKGDFEKQDYNNPDLLVGLHIESSGYVLLESLHPTQKIHFARGTSTEAPRRLLPRSKPPTERMLVMVDSDASIFINTEALEFKIGSLGSSAYAQLSNTGDEENEDPHILVQQSYPQESLRRGETDLGYLTPAAIPETIQEEPRVHETPSVKSRFMDPNSATITRGPLREDTFGEIEEVELTPRAAGSVTKSFVASLSSNGLMFGGHNSGRLGETVSQLSVIDDADMSTSDEEELVQTSKFFKPVEPQSIESTADEEEVEATVLISRGNIAPMAGMGGGGEEEVRESGAEDMRRQFSEAPMITSFTYTGSAPASKEASPAEEEEADRKRGGVKDQTTPVKPMKKGIPEGFLYEEHKKEVTPKQTYGRGKRTPRAKPKGKSAEMDEIVGRAIGEDEIMQNDHVESAKARNNNKGRPRQAQQINDTDGSEGEDENMAIAEEDTVLETADEEAEDEEIAPPPRTQGRRGRKIVESQPDSTATTVILAESQGRSVRTSNRARKTQEDEEPDIEEKEAELASTMKPTRPKRGARRASQSSETMFSTAPEAAPKVPPGTKPTRATKKRGRTSDIEEDQESLDGVTEPYSSRAGTVESTIQVSTEPKSKRPKTATVKKPAAKTPASRRGKRKTLTPSPPENSGKILGDTQYTFPDDTQTQTIDHVEIKTPKSKKKSTPAKASARKKADREPTEEQEVDAGGEDGEVDSGKTRTRDRYEGDSPKIVFSNSGLDGKKDIEKFLRTNGGKKAQNVSAPGVNFLVVGPGELKRTPKLTVGVALGKWVVEDQWLIDSKEVGYFLDPDQYIPNDPTHEKAWSFSLRTAIARGRNGENNILKDHNIYITPSLLTQLKASKQEESLVEMLKAAGASSIIKKAPKGKKEDDDEGDNTLILGSEKSDGDVSALEKLGWNVYGTGIIAISVLRGKLEVGEEEFRIVAEKEGSQKVGRGRKGK